MPTLLATAAFLSGAAALFYETLWARFFSIILGSTAQGSACIFSAFLIGLAIGAHLGGKRLDKTTRPAIAYCLLELSIVATGVATGFILEHFASSLIEFTPDVSLGLVPALWCFAVACLVVPSATLMGATFPAMLASARHIDLKKNWIGYCYAFNIAGGALGTIACGFFTIRLLGVTNSLGLAALFNIGSALCCLIISKLAPAKATQGKSGLQEDWDTQALDDATALSPLCAIVIATMSGFTVMSLELLWLRLCSFFVGNRVFAITTVLSCVLVALALGSWFIGRIFRTATKDPNVSTSIILLVSAAVLTISAHSAVWWITQQRSLESILPGFSEMSLLYRTTEASLFILPTFLALGCLFPMTLLASRHTGSPAQTSGKLYLFNTLGCVTGALTTTFYAQSAIGTLNTIKLLTIVLLIAAFFLAVKNSKIIFIGVAASSATLLVLVALPAKIELPREGRIIKYEETETGIFQLTQYSNGYIDALHNGTQLVNYLGSPATAYVQGMQAHLPMLYRPKSKRIAVMGSGYGLTAGTFTLYPGVVSIDAVEILRSMVGSASEFESHTHAYQKQPQMHIHINDGRSWLAKSHEKFDVISLNISVPEASGSAKMFNREFYRLARQHLSPNGVLVQHVFGKDTNTMIATIKSEFPQPLFFAGYSNSFNVLMSDGPLILDHDAIAQALKIPKVAADLRNLELSTFSEVVAAATPENPSRFANLSSEVSSDDHPIIEFSWDNKGVELFNLNE